MPEYLAPGVFVEEVSYRAKSIEGVSTTTTGFVGPTRYGPIDIEPEIITSLVEFERVYGGKQILELGGVSVDNYMWNAVRAFFEEGGKRLYVARTYAGFDPAKPEAGCATSDSSPSLLNIRARFPGKAGNLRVTLQFNAGPNRFTIDVENGLDKARFRGLRENDIYHISNHKNGSPGFYSAVYEDPAGWFFDDGKGQKIPIQDFAGPLKPDATSPQIEARLITATIIVESSDRDLPTFALSELSLDPRHEANGAKDSIFSRFDEKLPSLAQARTVPIIINTVSTGDADEKATAAQTKLDAADAKIALAQTKFNTAKTEAEDAKTALDAIPDGDARRSAAEIDLNKKKGKQDQAKAELDATKADKKTAGDEKIQADELVADLAAAAGKVGLALLGRYYEGQAGNPAKLSVANLLNAAADLSTKQVHIHLVGGIDGDWPQISDYEGEVADPQSTVQSGIKAFENLEDISIVAAPGSSAQPVLSNAQAVANALISHCRLMKYRIAVIDCPPRQEISEVRAYRGKFDSSHAAFYYPWVRIVDPNTGQENHYPPSGFVAGIYARNDVERAVYKAPANEVVNLAIGFERLLSKSHQEVLNPEGINCFRFFEGRGMRLWGARTMSSDPEWKYVNLRRYFAFLERSIDKGTQWAVFEPNCDRLWAKVRQTIEDFLLNEWQNGALLGERKEKAYFVKCDRTTMTQNDLDNGRLVCQIGVAALRPAEFVIFRIGQWTADAKS
jgi:uncharacterized protein